MAIVFKTLSATLAANVNELTFTDAIINSNSVIEVYYNSNDVYTVETWQDGTTIGIVTSDHNFPVGVKVTINNVISFEPYDDTDLINQINGLSDDVGALDDRLDSAEDDIDSLETRVGNAEDDIDALESSKQDLLTAGDNITIENNVISSNASGGTNDYSTTEKLVGKWIDNKNLYEKTFYIDNLSIYSNTVITTLTNIDTLIFKFAIFRESSAAYMLPDMSGRIMFNSSGDIIFSPASGSSWIGAITFTILYTKINE